MNKNDTYDFDFRYILRTIISKWYIVLIMIILGSSFAYYKIKYKTVTIYQAKSSLMVGNPINGQETKFEIQEINLYERYVQTYCALARTDLISTEVANKLGNGISPAAVQGSINVSSQENTQFINLVFRWSTQEGSINILNTFDEVFVNKAKELYPTCKIQVIDKPKSIGAITTNNKKYLIFGPMAGVVMAILIILGIEFLDNTLRTEEDIKEYLNSTVIGEIPKDKKMIDRINSETIKSFNCSMIEAFRTVRTNIEFISSCNSLKSFIVTSARPGEGKTLIASMISVMLAQTGKNTIIVDCDLRNPNIHKRFRITNEVGLSNYLAGKTSLSSAVSKSSIDNLYVLTSGIKPPNPAELLSSQNMKALIRTLRNDYDYIIFDTPPVGLVTDAQILSQMVDGSVFVVSAGKSIKSDTIKAKELIRQVGGNIIGVTLNNIKYSPGYKDYSYYYHGNSKQPKEGDLTQEGDITV